MLAGPAVYDEFVDALTERPQGTKTGGPTTRTCCTDRSTTPTSSSRSPASSSALPDHAKVEAGGHRRRDEGYFYAPTVVSDLTQDDEMIQNEVFGPVITVQRFTRRGRRPWRGPTASSTPWPRRCGRKDHARAMRMSKRLDFGCVWINTHIPLVAEMPHGGFKQSGYGKDLSVYGFEDYTRIKHVMSNLE